MNELKKKKYYNADTDGDIEISVYEVFHGIEVVYRGIHTDRFHMSKPTKENDSVIEIHCCCEGRVEQETEDGFFYLAPGDLSLTVRTERPGKFYFPLKHYHGFSVVIDIGIADEDLLKDFSEEMVTPFDIATKLLGENQYYVLRSNHTLEQLFQEWNTIPAHMQLGYLKIKVLELLMILSGLSVKMGEKEEMIVSKEKRELAQNAVEYMMQHKNRRVTIAELSKYLNVSESSIKNVFKSVYGMPIYTYIRVQKMQSAAVKLLLSDSPVLEIANEFGYENGSKFATAFCEVMGETPNEYRKHHAVER